MRERRHQVVRMLVAMLMPGALLAGCSDDGRTLRPPGSSTPPATTPPATPSTTPAAPSTVPATTPPASPTAVVARVCAGAATLGVAGPLPGDFPEISGLVASRSVPGMFWAIQDSGNPAEVIAFDPVDESFRRVEVDGVTNFDWEDLAIGPDPTTGDGNAQLWVADIGDNFTIRRNVRLHHFAEPGPDADRVEPQTIVATIEGGARDAEALFVAADGVWLVEKRAAGPSGVYRLDGTVFRREGEIDVRPAVVTGADVAVDGAIVVRTNRSLLVFAPVADDGSVDVMATLRSEPCAAPTPPEVQGESVAFTADGAAIVTVSERGGGAETVDVHLIE